MEFYAAERKKELIPFATAWMKLESIMLSEISEYFIIFKFFITFEYSNGDLGMTPNHKQQNFKNRYIRLDQN